MVSMVSMVTIVVLMNVKPFSSIVIKIISIRYSEDPLLI